MARHSRPKKASRAQPPRPQAADLDPEVRGILDSILELERASPEGWGSIASVLRGVQSEAAEALLPILARQLGTRALPLLRGLALEDDASLGIAATKSLALLGTRAAGDALVEAFHVDPEGERGRAAWEGVRALQARGINLELPEPAGVRREALAWTLREAWSSLPDGAGSVSIFIRMQDHFGVWQTIAIVLNEIAGVKDGFTRAISQREFRDFLERAGPEGMVHAPAPLDYVRWEVARARETNRTSRFPLEDDLDDWDAMVGPPPPDYVPPDPAASLRRLPPQQRGALSLESLLVHPMFFSWGIEPADTRPWRRRWLALAEEDGPTIERLLGEAADRLVSAQMQARYRERMRGVARKLEWRNEPDLARLAAAAALDIEDAARPSESAFMRGMVANGLQMLDEMLAIGEDPELCRYDPMRPID